MSESKECIKEELLRKVDSIVDEISKGNDVEVRKSISGDGIKILSVKKKVLISAEV